MAGWRLSVSFQFRRECGPACYNARVKLMRRRALAVHQRLLGAYGEPRWRNPMPPIDELVSTILSQNTNDLNRDRAFTALRQAFPTWEAVRDAPARSISRAIRPAGLANLKGPRIKAVLRAITKERGSLDLGFLRRMSPEQAMTWLMRFKGVGRKTASIVLLFSLGMPAFPVDTHIYRLSGRLGLRPEGASLEQTHDLLAQAFPPEAYYSAHLNLIRHGREVCHARNPVCAECILHRRCPYGRSSREASRG